MNEKPAVTWSVALLSNVQALKYDRDLTGQSFAMQVIDGVISER